MRSNQLAYGSAPSVGPGVAPGETGSCRAPGVSPRPLSDELMREAPECFTGAYGVHEAIAGTGSHACRQSPTLRRSYGKTPRVVKCTRRYVMPEPSLIVRPNVSCDQAVHRTVLGTRQFHTLLRHERGEQLIQKTHDAGVSGELVGPVALDRLDAV